MVINETNESHEKYVISKKEKEKNPFSNFNEGSKSKLKSITKITSNNQINLIHHTYNVILIKIINIGISHHRFRSQIIECMHFLIKIWFY